MRVVSIDICPQGSQHRIHLGPFVAGLNAVFGSRGAGKSTIVKFIRQLLFSRYRDRSGSDYRTTDELVGTLQWADANGNARVISTSDPIELNDYRFSGAYHWSTRHDHLAADAVHAYKPSEQPWHRIGGETFDAVFCGRLGETLPERLWAAARELGIAIRFDLSDDETYRRLRAEERRLQERLHHLRVDDRDHAWWTAERRRLASRLEELRAHPELAVAEKTPSYIEYSLENRPVFQQWRSQLTDLQSRLAEAQRREAELARQVSDLEYRRDHYEAAQRADNVAELHSRSLNGSRRSTEIREDAYGAWVGYADRLNDNDPHFSRSARTYSTGNHAAGETLPPLHDTVSQLQAQRAQAAKQIEELHRSIRTLESNLKNAHHDVRVDATLSWEVEDLQKRLSYADEVLQSWSLYERTRTQLVEVQNQLRGHGPYRQGFESSFLNSVERYIRELSAGSLRGLPTWAMEALRRDQSYVTGLSRNGKPETYRQVYRDYRPDASQIDFVVPPSTAPERQIVELAIRMAIIEASAHRIGRLPLILDDALDGFHGQQLDHLVRVMMQFAKDGMQVMLLTSEHEVAQRVRAQQGWVAHLNCERGTDLPGESLDRAFERRVVYSRPDYRTDWVAPAATYAVSHDYRTADINRILASEADRYVIPDERPVVTRHHYSEPVVRTKRVIEPSATIKLHPQFFLAETSRLEDGPGLNNGLAEKIRLLGIHNVGQFIETDPQWIADSLHLTDVNAADIRSRQREALLMCCVPQLRAFDARVLVGCGIDKPAMLAEMRPAHLLNRVESFLATDRGQQILRSGTSYELSRITTWIASARRALHRDRNYTREYDREPTIRVRTERERAPRGERTRREYTTTERVSQTRPRSAETASTRSPRSSSNSNTGRNGSSNSQSFVTRTERPVQVRTERTFMERSPRTVPSERTGFVRTERTARTTERTTSERRHRFYLELDSPIVDAPSIGPRMAERLIPMGMVTVRDLLNCNPERVASQLDDKRFDAGTIRDWQDQARLVCTIPNLRGHDAQILVACDVRTADQLAVQQADALLASSASFASSKAGQRLLRGAAGPDRAEVVDWINWSRDSRPIKAA